MGRLNPATWTLDLGNSRLKLVERRVSPGPPDAGAADASQQLVVFANDARLVEELRARLDGLDLLGVAFSSVASESQTEELRALLRAHTSTFIDSSEALIRNETRTPQTVGSDRLFAGLGTLQLMPSSASRALVVDAGTALTVDLVERSSSATSDLAARGSFLGGAIAPGPELLAGALARGGARLLAVDSTRVSPSTVPALGRDTEAALLSGILHGFRGAARELVDRIAGECHLSATATPLYLTGGARGLLSKAFGAWTVHEEPGLVDRGLLAALEFELHSC